MCPPPFLAPAQQALEQRHPQVPEPGIQEHRIGHGRQLGRLLHNRWQLALIPDEDGAVDVRQDANHLRLQ